MWMVSDAGSAGIASATGTVMELVLGTSKHASKSTSSAAVTRRENCWDPSNFVVVIVVVVAGGNLDVDRLMLQDAAHGAVGGGCANGWATGIGSVQMAAELLVEIRDLNLELGFALRQTLSDDVIDKAVTVFQVVAWQLASKADKASWF